MDMLDGAMECRLCLVSAPAGFGKTTLLGEWIALRGVPVAWLSLDQSDGSQARICVRTATQVLPCQSSTRLDDHLILMCSVTSQLAHLLCAM